MKKVKERKFNADATSLEILLATLKGVIRLDILAWVIIEKKMYGLYVITTKYFLCVCMLICVQGNFSPLYVFCYS
jgi:hypothetical protein